MSKAEILDELPRLTARDRSQLFARLAELHETDLISGGKPTPAERQALDEALTEFERDRNPGESWRDVFREIPGISPVKWPVFIRPKAKATFGRHTTGTKNDVLV